MWAAIISLVGLVWDGIQAIADYAIIALTYAYNALKAFAGAIWDVGRFTWDNVLKPVGEWLHAGYERLKAIYDRVLAPVIKWADRITKAIRDVYNAYFRPILSAIDGVRRVLELLSLLHIQWAQQLDDALAALERKLTAPILEIISVVNRWVNRIESFVLTVDNLFVRVTHLGSIRRDLNSITNLHLNRLFSTITPTQKQGSIGMQDYTPPDDRLTVFDTITAGDDSASPVDVEAALRLFESYARGEPFSMWTDA